MVYDKTHQPIKTFNTSWKGEHYGNIYSFGGIKKRNGGEWNRIYEESLELVKAFPLAERGTISYAGQQLICAVRTKEREVRYRSSTKRGWCAEMDYDTLNCAEEYCLLKDFVDSKDIDSDAGDAMMGVVPNCTDYDWEQEKFNHTYSLWGAKTQGEPYHMYLLSIACMIEDRLGEKAFTYGDITQGQCRKAVEIANQYLKVPIRLPARCDMERLYRRIQQLPIEENDKVKVFEYFYLGEKNKIFYDFMQNHFHADVIQTYWENRFADSRIGTRGFVKDLKEYLLSGAGLEKLCGIVCMEDNEGNPQYKKFIYAIMDSKLYIKQKNTEDYLDIQQQEEQPYSIWTLMADFAYGSAHNRKVDRYIPIEEIRQALRRGIGDKCDTDQYINQYLEKEAAAPEINVCKENITEEELGKMADTDAAEVFTQFYHKMTEEKQYAELMEGSHNERCIFLIEQNQQLLLRDKDWLGIFSDMMKHPESYERYYPMVRVRADDRGLNRLIMALVLNDALYESTEEWSREYE